MKDPTKTAQHSVIVELQGENGKLREQLRESEAKAAEMRGVIEDLTCRCLECDPKMRADHALSTSCGQGWRSPAEWDALNTERDRALAIAKETAKYCAQIKAIESERDALAAQCQQLRDALVKDHDKEIGDFQERVRNIVIDLTGAPDDAIDGKGSDAGWEEFTLAEISQGIAFVIDQRDALASQCQQLREALRGLQHADKCYCDASFSGPGCHPRHSPECEVAMQALSSTPPPRMVAVDLQPTIELLTTLRGFFGLQRDLAERIDSELARLEALKDGK